VQQPATEAPGAAPFRHPGVALMTRSHDDML